MVFVFAAFVHFSIQCKYLRKDVEQQSFINVSCLRGVKLTTPLARSSPGVVIPRWGVVKASAWDNHLKRLALRSGCRWVKLWKSLPSSCSDMLEWFCRGFSGYSYYASIQPTSYFWSRLERIHLNYRLPWSQKISEAQGWHGRSMLKSEMILVQQ